ncbi:probable nucleolar protein 5-2 [Cyclospora cayetanensis]|uniref:Probable nucleolar protein 5-2 n=1 Tax=Cyclospora cayetanensis TaxID=88456 RepID=A0A6P6RTH2_9EIME|nr:probable nucleolar protein 5-2 [Cyclospora cayetanensis]
MLALLETSAGFALFRIKKGKLLEVSDVEALQAHFASPEAAQRVVELHAFSRFKDTKQATEEVLALVDSKVGKGLKKFLKKNLLQAEGESSKLVVADKALGVAIKNKLGLEVLFSPQTHEIIRGIKEQFAALMDGIEEKDRQQMAMSLSHSLNRFKLRFSPEKLDTMIIQAVALLDDLDKELNNFAMRLKEWYGWHFPELAKVITDNLVFAKAVKLIGFRTNTKHADLESILPDEICSEVRMSAETSMGTEMTDDDLLHITSLASRVEELVEYRANLAEYLKLRMKAVAPNLTHMVGEVIGARLMAHSGSLLSLSKQPASTLQILGAEKALFRALKTKSNTPKYGIIYHAALVGQATPKIKGKISRVLAAKLSLCVRVDALTEAAETAAAETAAGTDPVAAAGNHAPAEPSVAIACRRYVENKLEQLEQQLSSAGGKPGAKPSFQRYEPHRATNGMARKYDASTDVVLGPDAPKRHMKHVGFGADEATDEVPRKKKVKAEAQD